MDQLEAEARPLAAPEIIELELLQTLRRLVRHNHIDQTQAENALLNLEALHIQTYSHTPLRHRIWELRDNLTAYDAAYFALAELLDAPLWTRDKKFQNVPGHEAHVEIL